MSLEPDSPRPSHGLEPVNRDPVNLDTVNLDTGELEPAREAGNLRPFARTLEQELTALLRGVSLECLVCGEFVMHAREGAVFCPECSSALGTEEALTFRESGGGTALEFGAQAG